MVYQCKTDDVFFIGEQQSVLSDSEVCFPSSRLMKLDKGWTYARE